MFPDGFPRVVRYVFMISHDSSMIFLEFSNFPMMVLWLSYDLHDFSMVFLCFSWFSNGAHSLHGFHSLSMVLVLLKQCMIILLICNI